VTLEEEGRLAALRELLSSPGPGRRIIHVKRGSVAMTKGSRALHYHMVLLGKINRVATSGDRTVTIEVCGPNHWIYEEARQHGEYQFSAVASLDSDLIAIDSKAFELLVQEHPALFPKFMDDTAKQSLGRLRAICDQLLNSADRRLARALLDYFDPQDTEKKVETTPKRLADEVGTTRQNITRILHQFSDRTMLTKLSRSLCVLPGTTGTVFG